jgi:hypothetical protein
MDIYQIVSAVVAVVGIGLMFSKKTSLYGYCMIGVYFAIQGIALLKDGIGDAIPMFSISLLVGALAVYRYRSQGTKK